MLQVRPLLANEVVAEVPTEVYGPPLVYLAFQKAFWTSVSSVVGWASSVLAGLAAGHSDRTGQDEVPRSRNRMLRHL